MIVRGLCKKSLLDRNYILDFDEKFGPVLKGKINGNDYIETQDRANK